MFKIRNIITISDYVTVINIIFGMLAILLHDFRFVYISIVFDALDGVVARKTNTVSEFGAELDSICDVVSFGVAPAYLIYYYFDSTVSIIGSIIFLIGGALRLARFGILDVKHFIGLPIPAAALFLCILTQMSLKYGFGSGYVVSIIAVISGILMISDINYPKYPKKPLLVVFGISIILSMFGVIEPLAICAVLYVLYGIFKMKM
ncbi:CDP-diacylglycerol--serine O-phosphatidyltransferase [Methanococcus maripaludis]|uniref:CDP-diacylglycerol--serine O-phosphatidyltransferase n=2 Tax=Methanococcus maripaludis TaxID=39152 RepID=Q6LY22_METMP|nr:CDP-diacylglycerol--serine O-phosphatidyltransferase [Methanococcus maripaludis]MBA2847066.1 CDP-diacylglycerol--serine O-phosphatidyltransferase [Methanococcus maripaludis]MBA2857860.1 CDP-diacylglycerol--serine O-phosphatidyltransferase [Methanococcus maripaludis]MBB6066920.1 CDP-diacylglycerol--serine O-phosphatidyltransferase [Methanococcus maripaludis]CAF30727.1 archaetidylserine synthase [Methanococcus maripaludis S2]